MKSAQQRKALQSLETVGGHLDAVIGMVEDRTSCPDVVKQLTVAQAGIEATGRVVFRNHLETCVATSIRNGRTEEVLDELMETLKYGRRFLRPSPEPSAHRETDHRVRS
ncbi:MAG: metal-sensing transcriptional repressor [Actinobacteria bacterium]|nr:metal-sensing transcriptional repressor [Actinomycetota bacterium]